MSDQPLIGQLESLGEELVLADVTDLPQLAQLHTAIESMAAALLAEFPRSAAAAHAAADRIQAMVMGETPDPAAALADIVQTFCTVQTVVRDGHGDQSAQFAILGDASGAQAPAAAGREAVAPQDIAPQTLEGDPDLLNEFILEANEHLDNADVHLLTLGTNPTDNDALNAVFRAFHTIKGVAGFLALGDVQRVAHEAEFLLDSARKGDVVIEGAAIDVTFDAVDMLKSLIRNVGEALVSGEPLAAPPGIPNLIEKIKAAKEGRAATDGPDSVEDIIKPLGEILVERGQANPATVEHVLDLQKLPVEQPRVGELLRRANIASEKQILEALQRQSARPERKLGEILVEMGIATSDDLARALDAQCKTAEPLKTGELLVNAGVPAKAVGKALEHQQRARQAPVLTLREPVKVDADRLDQLLDTIGELVIAESMVSQSPELRGLTSADLTRQLSQLDKITRELQEMATSLRMVPIRATFQKMARLVRDLSKKTGKAVEFESQGEDTELDKSVVDKIGDPLVHMVRNSVDHGLEDSVEERIAAGKPAAGTVRLEAYHQGGNIHIEIADDGKGLNREAILRKAVEKGLIAEGASPSDNEVWNLIFEPGFSTAKVLTEVSGRGVGMDVVRRNIEALRGSVDIHSERGVGTRFTIRLPLTLAIIDGMIVRVGRDRFIIPTLSILVSLRPTTEQVFTVTGKGEMIQLQGSMVPLLRLHQVYGCGGSGGSVTEGIVMVVEVGGRKLGLLIDDILGQQQIVIKSLGPAFEGLQGIAGSTIMPDGQVGLILDIGGLLKLAVSDRSLGQPVLEGELVTV